MHYERIAPSDSLGRFVKEYWIFENEDPAIHRQKIIPDGYSEVKEWCALQVQNDETFLDVLIGLRGWRNSSDRGVYYPLTRQSIEAFFNYDETYQRIYALQNSNNEDISRKSEIVITALNDAEDD